MANDNEGVISEGRERLASEFGTLHHKSLVIHSRCLSLEYTILILLTIRCSLSSSMHHPLLDPSNHSPPFGSAAMSEVASCDRASPT